MSSKKTKWTPKQWESHYEDFKVSKRLNTDGKEVEKMVCKYCAYSIDMNSRVAALIAQHIKTPKHKNLKEKEIKRSGRQLSLEETASRAKERQQKVESFNHDLARLTQLFLCIKLNQILEN
jgi:hypothetical protein